MDRELKRGIKKVLLLDTLLHSKNSLFSIFNEVEYELEEMFGGSKKSFFNLKEFMNKKIRP
jgi:hypothetical protein